MGKNESKHVCQPCETPTDQECFLVNADLNRALEEQIWKKSTKTGFNLANYNMDQSLSELSICLEEKPENKDNNIPLQVDLPPMKTDNDAKKVFVFDQEEGKEKGEKEGDSRLNIEEFECGVHFGGADNAKQEWSFTLYDFDGHGKITKEDLAGLLKALYDAVGSSIKIPNNGTKTLKLRLSVGQDSTLQANQTSTPDKNERDSSKKKDTCKNKENVKQKDLPKSKLKDFARLNNLTSNPVTAKCNNETQAQAMSAAMSESKSRLSSQEHRELAELVQENMDRNHIKPLRHHHSDCRACLFDHPHQKRRHRGMRTTNNTKKDNDVSNKLNNGTTKHSANNSPAKKDIEETPKESQDRRNYYLDLVGIENTSPMFQSPTALGRSPALKTELNNTPTRTQQVGTTTALCAERVSTAKHFRSRSHELGDRQCDTKQKPDKGETVLDNGLKPDHLRSKSLDTQKNSNVANVRAKGNPKTTSGRRPVRFRPVSLPADVPETISPHYHRRHRHREKDHDLAMQQVAEWIEREHTLDIDGDKIVIQRHEHHHVHEHHHHHHYHHYYEA